jgi:hypothetical protein
VTGHDESGESMEPLSTDERVKRMAQGRARAKQLREQEEIEEEKRLERKRIAAEEEKAEMKRRETLALAELSRFELHYDMLMALLTEMREFAKRKQDGPVTPMKIEMISRRLDELREILKDEEIFPFLENLDGDRVPCNSDVVLILAQYEVAMESHARGRYAWSPKGKSQRNWSIAKGFLDKFASSTPPAEGGKAGELHDIFAGPNFGDILNNLFDPNE